MNTQNIDFLTEIALSYNFESHNQEAYICVLFDLLLYKYPSLSKGVFELLVRLFTRKRTILENLQSIQMLENPRSIQVLNNIKDYQAQIKKYIFDCEIWINKSTAQSRQVIQKVIHIFGYFSTICQERTRKQMNQAEEEQEEKPLQVEKKESSISL